MICSLTTSLIYRTSGVGDHGEAGIKKFLSDHTCNSMCRELGLRDTSDPLKDRDCILMRHDQDKYDTESEDEEDEETENHDQHHSRRTLVNYESSLDDEEEGPGSA